MNELVQAALVPVIEEKLRGVEENHKGTKSTKTAKSDKKEELRDLRAFVVKQKEDALLSIRCVDPACGSGHFLLAAARRIGRELARVRAGGDEPSADAVRAATA
ncbi:SAM-dependent DNA methyltransferase, partial [Candidatus Gracilibacteria bacterium]|nr:SAM-dependent DNA methyltransferase [Candidatus Gracilibacteria bacterium]